MELKELTQKFIEIFGEIENFKTENVTDDNCEKFLKLINNNLEIDYLQQMWQFYMADREDKKQDFTPVSLAKLVAELTKSDNEEWVYDMCCGSGALTIQKWVSNKNLKFVCEELDENVIPFLLFNLKLRNIEGYILNSNVLTGERKSVFKLEKGEKFSKVTNQLFFEYPKFTTGISNPPFNLEGKNTEPIKFKKMNYSFIFKMLEKVEGKISFILPNRVMSSSDEEKAREYILKNKKLSSVISNPECMFASTSIPTCILSFEKNKNEITFIDCRYKNHSQEEREQKGELHTSKRVYKKLFNIYTDENIKNILDILKSKSNIENLSKTISISDVKDNNWQPSRYIELEDNEDKTRSYEDILKDLGRVISQKNVNRLVINETWAKEHNVASMIENLKTSDNLITEINKTISDVLKLDIKLDKQNWLTLSRNKELKFENNSKEYISPIIIFAIEQWKTFNYFLNQEENRYLKEFKEKLLNDLMSGKLDVLEFEI